MPNLPLLRQVLRHIDTNPEEWGQSSYACRARCGTRYCFAGWTCVLSGFEIDWGDIGISLPERVSNSLITGEVIFDKAMHLLDITGTEAYSLFSGSASRTRIEQIANQIAKRAGEPLWEEETSDEEESLCLEDELVTV